MMYSAKDWVAKIDTDLDSSALVGYKNSVRRCEPTSAYLSLFWDCAWGVSTDLIPAVTGSTLLSGWVVEEDMLVNRGIQPILDGVRCARIAATWFLAVLRTLW